MNALTAERTDLAAIIGLVLDDVWVYASPPATITVPCAVIVPGPAGIQREGYGRFHVAYEVWLYGDGADEGTMTQLEAMLAALLAVFPSASTGRTPGAARYGAGQFIGCAIDIVRAVVIDPVGEPVAPPHRPTGLAAMSVPGQLSVSLQWTDPDDVDIVGYHVYRDAERLTDEPDPVHNYSDIGGGLAFGVEYAYTVTAVGDGGESAPSDPATITLTQ